MPRDGPSARPTPTRPGCEGIEAGSSFDGLILRQAHSPYAVMLGLDPSIHGRAAGARPGDRRARGRMDPRVKPEGDGRMRDRPRPCSGGRILRRAHSPYGVMLGLDPSIHGSAREIAEQVVPCWIGLLDQPDLPGAVPPLQQLFPGDRGARGRMDPRVKPYGIHTSFEPTCVRDHRVSPLADDFAVGVSDDGSDVGPV